MRRTALIVATGPVSLAVAGGADAAGNAYTQSFVTRGGDGSLKHPAPVRRLTEILTTRSTVRGHRAADPLVRIRTSLAGLRLNTRSFPRCPFSRIEASSVHAWRFHCSKGSLLATGMVVSSLGNPDMLQAGATCDLHLSVYNAGGGGLVYFFSIRSASACAGLRTGAALPYTGSLRQSGKRL